MILENDKTFDRKITFKRSIKKFPPIILLLIKRNLSNFERGGRARARGRKSILPIPPAFQSPSVERKRARHGRSETQCRAAASLRAGTLKRSRRFTRDNINLRSRVVPRPAAHSHEGRGGGDPKGNSAVASKVAGSRARGMKHRVASWDREKFFFSSVHARRVSIHRLHPRVLRNDIRKSV